MPLESSQFLVDDEIVGITVSMIQKDMMWQNDHHQQAIRDLVILHQQLFNQRIKRYKFYKKTQAVRTTWNKRKMKIGKRW